MHYICLHIYYIYIYNMSYSMVQILSEGNLNVETNYNNMNHII